MRLRLPLTLAAAVLLVAPTLAHADDLAALSRSMAPVLDSYLTITQALADDRTDGVADAARAIAERAPGLDVSGVTGEHADDLKALPGRLATAARALAAAADIEAARTALMELSRPMALWASLAHPAGVEVVYCSMKEASWLQRTTAVSNPYYGHSMLRCGQVVTPPPATPAH